MSDNTAPPSAATVPAPPPPPAPAGEPPLRPVRKGFAGVLFALGIFLLGVALYYAVNARALGGTEGPAETWAKGAASKEVWPILLWAALCGLAGVVGAGLLGRDRPGADEPGWLSRAVGLCMLVGAGAAVLIPLDLLLTRSLTLAINPVSVGAIAITCILALCGAMLINDTQVRDSARLRLAIMVAGLAVGLVTLLVGVSLAVFTSWEDLRGGLGSWRQRPAVLAWPVGVYLAGVALMFLSIQPGMPLIRQNQNIRRTVFGANLTVTILLLLGVLALPNVLAYAEPMTQFFGRPFDWTKGGVNSLSPATRNYLAGLREPVKVYVVMNRNSLITQDVLTLLENCRSLSSNFNWELVSRLSGENQSRIVGFMQKYGVSDLNGLLIVPGNEEGSTHALVKAQDLADFSGMRGRSSGYTFKGESQLLGALRSLSEGKIIIYFTAGHGELALEGRMPKGRPPMGGGGGDLRVLKQRLGSRKNVEVRSLTIDATTKSVPKDATVVVVARPTRAFGPAEAGLLRDYVQRNAVAGKAEAKGKGKEKRESEEVTAGKLLLLLDPIIERGKGIADTGLEGLLGAWNVKLGMDRVMNLTQSNPLDVIAYCDPESTNPIAKGFNPNPRQITAFMFEDSRTVGPLNEGGGAKKVEPILVTYNDIGIWAEKNVLADPGKLRSDLRKRENQKELIKKLARDPLPIAVAVSDSGTPPGMPRDAAHAAAGKDTPRMVVFGTSSWLSDGSLQGRQGPLYLDLFNSCVTWVQGKSEAFGVSDVEDKERKPYDLGIPPDNFRRLAFLPLGLMVMAVLALGTGVWVVRRR